MGSQSPITVDDVRNEPSTAAIVAAESRIQSIVFAPILDPEGNLNGLFTAELDAGRPAFQPIESELLGAIAKLLSTSIAERKSRGERDAMQSRLAAVADLESLNRLVGTLARDFNDRLTVVLGIAERITQQCRGTRLEAGLEELMRSAEAAAVLTQRLQDVSAESPGGAARCDLVTVVRESHGLLRSLVPADVDLSIQILEEDLPAALSHHAFERILLDLVLNAVDTCDSGDSIEVSLRSIEVSADRLSEWPALELGRYAEVRVQDSGIGIGEERLQEIFEPFYSRKRSESGEGSGLFTVYGLVQGAGGVIAVDSVPGEGTKRTIRLPVEQGTGREDLERRSIPVLTSRHATILLVEDNEAVRSFTREILEQTGHRVIEAMNGRHALELVERISQPIHLLVTDVVMPDLGGVELADALGQRLDDLQVIFVSGYAPGFRGEEILQSPDRAFLPKPFSATRLLEEVDARLAQLGQLH